MMTQKIKLTTKLITKHEGNEATENLAVTVYQCKSVGIFITCTCMVAKS